MSRSKSCVDTTGLVELIEVVFDGISLGRVNEKPVKNAIVRVVKKNMNCVFISIFLTIVWLLDVCGVCFVNIDDFFNISNIFVKIVLGDDFGFQIRIFGRKAVLL